MLLAHAKKTQKGAAALVRFAGASAARVYAMLSRRDRRVEVRSGLVKWASAESLTEPGRAFAETLIRGWAAE